MTVRGYNLMQLIDALQTIHNLTPSEREVGIIVTNHHPGTTIFGHTASHNPAKRHCKSAIERRLVANCRPFNHYA
jgi:hypothetical protein